MISSFKRRNNLLIGIITILLFVSFFNILLYLSTGLWNMRMFDDFIKWYNLPHPAVVGIEYMFINEYSIFLRNQMINNTISIFLPSFFIFIFTIIFSIKKPVHFNEVESKKNQVKGVNMTIIKYLLIIFFLILFITSLLNLVFLDSRVALNTFLTYCREKNIFCPTYLFDLAMRSPIIRGLILTRFLLNLSMLLFSAFMLAFINFRNTTIWR